MNSGEFSYVENCVIFNRVQYNARPSKRSRWAAELRGSGGRAGTLGQENEIPIRHFSARIFLPASSPLLLTASTVSRRCKQPEGANAKLKEQLFFVGTSRGRRQRLSERLREGNILIGSLQQQLALPKGNRKHPEVVDESGDTERAAASGPSEPVHKSEKRSLLARILRR